MVIFHSCVNVYQRVFIGWIGLTDLCCEKNEKQASWSCACVVLSHMSQLVSKKNGKSCNLTCYVHSIYSILHFATYFGLLLDWLGFRIIQAPTNPPIHHNLSKASRRSHRMVWSLNPVLSSLGNHSVQWANTWKPWKPWTRVDSQMIQGCLGKTMDTMEFELPFCTVGSCNLPCVQSWDFDELEWPQWLTSRNHPSWGWWTIIIHHHSFWQNTKWELRHWLNYGLIWWFGGVLPKWSTVCELCKFDLAFLNAFNAMLMTGKSRHSRPLNAKHCLIRLG